MPGGGGGHRDRKLFPSIRLAERDCGDRRRIDRFNVHTRSRRFALGGAKVHAYTGTYLHTCTRWAGSLLGALNLCYPPSPVMEEPDDMHPTGSPTPGYGPPGGSPAGSARLGREGVDVYFV